MKNKPLSLKSIFLNTAGAAGAKLFVLKFNPVQPGLNPLSTVAIIFVEKTGRILYVHKATEWKSNIYICEEATIEVKLLERKESLLIVGTSKYFVTHTFQLYNLYCHLIFSVSSIFIQYTELARSHIALDIIVMFCIPCILIVLICQFLL